MVIKMKKNEKDLGKSARAALLACLSNSPFLKIIEVKELADESGKKRRQPPAVYPI
jgi:hypothetical protein